MPPDPAEELIEYAVSTPCKRKPWTCQPRKVTHVSLDADDTMWEIHPHLIASNVCAPFKLVDPDTLEGTECGYRPSTPKPKEKPYAPVGRVYNEKTKKWEWLHEREEAGEWELEEQWWKTPEIEGGESVDDIEKELLESLSPSQRNYVQSVQKGMVSEKYLTPQERKVLQEISRIKGEQLSLISVSKPGKPEKKPEAVKPPKGQPITVKLLPTMRQTLDDLKKRGITMSVISLNAPGSVKDIIKAFGLSDRFIEIEDSWKNKGDVFKTITDKHKIPPCQTIFVDNLSSHVAEVSKTCGLGLVIGPTGDISKPIDIFKYIEGASTK